MWLVYFGDCGLLRSGGLCPVRVEQFSGAAMVSGELQAVGVGQFTPTRPE